MKGDFTRSTFRPSKHHSGVRLQQGRILLDADWNEQVDIQAHRERTAVRDVVGFSGAPLRYAGFALTVEGGNLRIGRGRYYVDGVPCEAEQDVAFAAEDEVPAQPDLPGAALPTNPGRYVAYLDVWERHITAFEDPAIREVALGGPDTTTRTRTVWQVKLEPAGNLTRGDLGAGWAPENARGTEVRLRAQARRDAAAEGSPVELAGSGYRRLENQLYRVEIHDGGEPYGAPRSSATAVTEVLPNGVRVADDGQTWRAGQVVELFGGISDEPGTLARITAVDEEDRTLTLDKDVAKMTPQPDNLRPVATFKFSRDNGTVLAGLAKIEENRLVVSDPGKDPVTEFSGDRWVELSDEERALRGEPGVLVQVGPALGDELMVRNWPNGTPLTIDDFGTRPTVRRWDSERTLPVSVGGWLDLEDGVQVEFEVGSDTEPRGTFAAGDYWWIPARSLTRSVEWPRDISGEPSFEARHGVEHRYGVLALLQLAADGAWSLESDLRQLFAPVAEEVGIHVIDVFVQSTDQPDQPLRHGIEVPADQLAQGLRLECAAKVDQGMVDERHRCLVALDIPFTDTNTNRMIGFRPLVLASEVNASGRAIVWNPSVDARTWLEDALFDSPNDEAIPAHLRIEGSTFDIGFRVAPSKDMQVNIGFLPNLRSVMFSEQAERLDLARSAFNFAIDREKLREVLPIGYETETNQFDQNQAIAYLRFLVSSRGLPRGTPMLVLVDERYSDVGRSVADMVFPVFRDFVNPELMIESDVASVVDKVIEESKGALPTMVIGDQELADKLTTEHPASFPESTLLERF